MVIEKKKDILDIRNIGNKIIKRGLKRIKLGIVKRKKNNERRIKLKEKDEIDNNRIEIKRWNKMIGIEWERRMVGKEKKMKVRKKKERRLIKIRDRIEGRR